MSGRDAETPGTAQPVPGGRAVPPELAAELEKLYPWQQRLFWAVIEHPGPLVIQHGRRNGMATVRRLVQAWHDST